MASRQESRWVGNVRVVMIVALRACLENQPDVRETVLMASDEELLRRFVGGDEAALGLLADRYECRLLDLACAVLRSRDAAMDAVQETWLRVIRSGHTFNGNSAFKTWLYRIAVNHCRSMLRRSDRRERQWDETAEEPTDIADSPDRCAERDDDRVRLRRLVEGLSHQKREVVLLCHMHGFSYAEAAAVLRVPVGTVKSRVHHALNDLRAQWQQEAHPNRGES